MKISLISPAAVQSTSGNYTTAIRWKRILQELGHQVHLEQQYSGHECDLMIALHAWRSAHSIENFKYHHKDRSLIVALTGTDIYRYIHTHPQQTLASMILADQLVGLHDEVSNAIPRQFWKKLNIIFQASTLKPIRRLKNLANFDVCVAGHLRAEKDPLRVAYAMRSVPKSSQLRVRHFGRAHTAGWQRDARLETCRNSRYHWFGEVSHSLLRRELAKCKLLVLPSRMEGGANIISEAIMVHLPVIASSIDGSTGLLGSHYQGYYDLENTHQLRNILLKCERQQTFYQMLHRQCNARLPLFSSAREKHLWQQLLARL